MSSIRAKLLATALILFLAIFTVPCRLHAQVLYGSLTGTVTDSSGGAIPGAKVEALNTATGIGKQATTDDRGQYQFNDLQPGTYKVTIQSTSFASRVQEGVLIDANEVRRLDASMQLSQVSETVLVSAASVTLQTDRAEVSAQFKTSQLADLPMLSSEGRNFQSLYKLVPGFSPPAELHSDAGNPQRAMGTNVNGMTYSNNNTKLDGATVSYPWLPHIVAYVPPAEAVEAVNIVTNSFDAEQGMAGGAAINVAIKSGTNDYHGGVWEYHTNSDLKARNYFYCLYSCGGDPNRPPKNILNQFGGMFGGPIKKNKLFLFVDWERTHRRQTASALRTIPTDGMRKGDFNGTSTTIFDPATGNANGTGRTAFPGNQIPANRIAFASGYMANLIPAPNQSVFPNNYLATATYQFNRDNADFKVNYNPTERVSMFGRYSISPSNLFDPPSLGAAGGDATNGGQPGTAPGRVQSVSYGGSYTLSPTVLFDGVLGYTRLRLGAQNVDIDKKYGTDVLKIPGTNGADFLQGGYPRFTITGMSSIGNPNVSNPFLFRDNQYVANANLGWIRTSHSLRFGFEYAKYDINHFQPQASNGPRGGFNFTGGLTALSGGAAPNLYSSWADFLLGLPATMGKDLQYENPATVRMPSYGLYARDQWTISRKLTIDYGIRYEFYPAPRRDHYAGERYDPATDKVVHGGYDVGKGQVAPRFGVAYRLNERTVIRSGFGISIDPGSFRYLRDGYPATISTQYSGASSFQAAGDLITGLPDIIGPDLSQPVLSMPAAVGTTSFPQKYDRGYIESYNFTVQRDAGAGFNVQAGYVGSRGIRQTAIVNINAAGPGGGTNGRALYPQFQRISDIKIFEPFGNASYNALQTRITRRAGASLFGITYTWSRAISFADNSDSSLTWNWTPMLGRNKALAGFDRTHNFQFFGNYEAPFGKGKKWATSGFAAAIAGGWQVNWIMGRTSGTPFTVQTSGTSVNAPGNTQTADQVLPSVAILGGHGVGQPYFDPNAFAPVTAVRFGTAGRDTVRGPGVFNLDGSIFRTFRLTERFNLQFRAEMFGVTNTPQFGNPGATVSNAVRNPDGSIRTLSGYDEITSASGERQARFALKLFF
jgi:hypothetical protein